MYAKERTQHQILVPVWKNTRDHFLVTSVGKYLASFIWREQSLSRVPSSAQCTVLWSE
jgi:hypothetical protein